MEWWRIVVHTYSQHKYNTTKLKKKKKKSEVTHVEIIKKKYPSLIALAKLMDSTELLWFGKCGMVANCVTYLQSTQIQHHRNFFYLNEIIRSNTC